MYAYIHISRRINRDIYIHLYVYTYLCIKANVKDVSLRLSYMYVSVCLYICITCKRGSVGRSESLFFPRSSVCFLLILIPENSNPHGFELHGPSIKGTKVLLKVIKAIIIII